jgi:hypothetical protein
MPSDLMPGRRWGPLDPPIRHARSRNRHPAICRPARIADAVGPSDSQQGRLDELAKANTRAIAILQAACRSASHRRRSADSKRSRCGLTR